MSNGNARAWLCLVWHPLTKFCQIHMPDRLTENRITDLALTTSSGSAFQQSTARLVKQLSRWLLENTRLRSLQPCPLVTLFTGPNIKNVSVSQDSQVRQCGGTYLCYCTTVFWYSIAHNLATWYFDLIVDSAVNFSAFLISVLYF